MSPARRLHRRVAGIAILAMLLQLLAPPRLLAKMAAAEGSFEWIEVCTHLGHTRLVPASVLSGTSAATDARSKSAHANAAFGDCQSCSHQGLTAPPRETVSSGRVALAGRPLEPALFLDAPDPSFAWAAAQSRGPPSLI